MNDEFYNINYDTYTCTCIHTKVETELIINSCYGNVQIKLIDCTHV